MSGPKDYSPPPRYSIQVFDGKLNKIFLLQNRLKQLFSDIETSQLSDKNHNIHFDCKSVTGKLKYEINMAIKPMVFDYSGTFGQETYNKISTEIDAKISELLKLTSECELSLIEFGRKMSDYQSYLSFLSFHNNSRALFFEFRNQVIHYLTMNLGSRAPEILEESMRKISNINLSEEKTKFDFGFSQSADSKKQELVGHIVQHEEKIHKIRAEISDKIIGMIQIAGTGSSFDKKTEPVRSADSERISEKIKSLIRNCDDDSMKLRYKAEYEKLCESESLQDPFFFAELHDSIYRNEKTRKAKTKITSILSELNRSPFHSLNQDMRINLIRLSLKLLNNSTISKNEFDDFQCNYNALKKDSKEHFEEDEIKCKERLFLKSQLILCLENQGYEVMDDLQVIDFEKENDFLLKIKGQKNFLNLKFKEDGSMRYAFKIPENVDDLDADQKNLKIHEMKVTCSDFKTVLNDLSKMGLKLNLRSEKPADAFALTTLSGDQKGKITEKHGVTHQEKQLRKRYLN
jgi:Txe/YoeB family toxin of Txe-Axe toxin-antitoxin module/predicted small metal-binding protein